MLKNVSLEVWAGEAIYLFGPNGGGKTTLLRLLAGEVAPFTGTRSYGLGGTVQTSAVQTSAVQTSAVQARRKLSLVGPDAEAFYLTRDWVQTVEDVLLAGFEGELLKLWEPSETAKTRLIEVSQLTGLNSLLQRDFRTLSHGQRRRVILARALMPSPEILLLDEFTDGLSEQARAELEQVLLEVQQAGITLILATHRPAEAPALAWRSIRVQQGEISEVLDKLSRPQAAQTLKISKHWDISTPPQSYSEPLVQITKARVYRNGHLALGPVSWQWQSGQHWLVTGENGSGKSTLARLVAGEFYPALGGHIARPYLPSDLLVNRQTSIGYVGAEVGIRQRRAWTGFEIISSAFAGSEGFSPDPSPAQAQQVKTLAQRLDLSDLLSRDAETLSQGQLRRLLLARAIVHGPKLLILDEGLDFLDAPSRDLFTGLLPQLIANGTHLMVIAHRKSDVPVGLTHHLKLDNGLILEQSPLN